MILFSAESFKINFLVILWSFFLQTVYSSFLHNNKPVENDHSEFICLDGFFILSANTWS